MSDHLWVTGTHTYNGITGRMALHQTTYVPHRRSLRRQNILFFSSQKHFGITATRFESRRSSAVTEMPSSHQIALAITDPEGGKWTLNVTLMVHGREKMSQYYRQLATDLARSRTLGSRLFHIRWLLQFLQRRVEANTQQCLTVSSVSAKQLGRQHKVSAHHEWMCLQAERHISLV